MFNSGILDVVIGLIFVFLLVSMLVTIGNELISAALLSRAKWLRRGMERLLGSTWAAQLYQHPLIEGYAKTPEGGAAGAGPTRSRGPSYIPSRAFANVLMQLLRDSATGLKEIEHELQSALNAALAPGATADTVQTRMAAVAAALRPAPGLKAKVGLDLAMLLDAIHAGAPQAPHRYTIADAQADIQRFIDAMPMRYMREVIAALPDERMHRTLLALLNDAHNDVEKFKENIETWFNNAMDRVSGWYKRSAQWVIAGLAVGAAVGMNVDAIQIARHLQTYPAAREALAGQAQAFAERSEGTIPTPGSSSGAGAGGPSVNAGDTYHGQLKLATPASAGTLSLSSSIPGITVKPSSVTITDKQDTVPFSVDTPFSDQPVTATITASGAATGAMQLSVTPSLPAQFRAVQAELNELGLPIGWYWTPTQAQIKAGQAIPRTLGDYLDRLLQHGLGWLITALAATLGAPFWFDTLNRMISIRSTGRAPEEKPKAPKEVPVPLEPGQSPQQADRGGLSHQS